MNGWRVLACAHVRAIGGIILKRIKRHWNAISNDSHESGLSNSNVYTQPTHLTPKHLFLGCARTDGRMQIPDRHEEEGE